MSEVNPDQDDLETEGTGVGDGPSANRDDLLGDVVEGLPVGIYRTAQDGEFVAVNDEFLSLFGASSRAELFEHRSTDFYVDEADREELLEALESEGALQEFEFEIETLSGERRWMTTTVAQVEETDRTYVEGTVRDVTEQKLTEADNEEYRRRLSQVAERSTDVLWLFTAEFDELLFMNEAYEDLWERPVAELEDEPTRFLQSVHEADRGVVLEAMEALDDGEPVDVEYRIVTPDDEVRWVWSRGAPVFDESGDVYRVAGFTRNITERKDSREQLREYREHLEETVAELERSNEELEQFAYVASHDLQEPLRMVSSYVDLLANEYEGELDEEADEYVDFAVSGARRMREMIDGLLEYSRVHTEAAEFDVVDGEALVESALANLQMQIDEADTTVTVGDVPEVKGDPAQLRQAIQNLVSNALTHGGESPSVHVSAEAGEDAVVFSVEDDGQGIDTARQEDLFEIFSRGHRQNDGGSGIGLAVCRRIVGRHGGDIWVDSEPGEGATFSFSLAQPPGESTSADPVDPEVVDS